MSFLVELEHLILILEPVCIQCCMRFNCMGEWETFTRCDKHKACMYYTEGNRFRLKQRLIKLNKTLSWRVYAVWSCFICSTSKTSYIWGHWRCVAPITFVDFILLFTVNKTVGRFFLLFLFFLYPLLGNNPSQALMKYHFYMLITLGLDTWPQNLIWTLLVVLKKPTLDFQLLINRLAAISEFDFFFTTLWTMAAWNN